MHACMHACVHACTHTQKRARTRTREDLNASPAPAKVYGPFAPHPTFLRCQLSMDALMPAVARLTCRARAASRAASAARSAAAAFGSLLGMDAFAAPFPKGAGLDTPAPLYVCVCACVSETNHKRTRTPTPARLRAHLRPQRRRTPRALRGGQVGCQRGLPLLPLRVHPLARARRGSHRARQRGGGRRGGATATAGLFERVLARPRASRTVVE